MRKFLVRWWWTPNHSQDRYQQAIAEWTHARDKAIGGDFDENRPLYKLFVASDSFNRIIQAAQHSVLRPN